MYPYNISLESNYVSNGKDLGDIGIQMDYYVDEALQTVAISDLIMFILD